MAEDSASSVPLERLSRARKRILHWKYATQHMSSRWFLGNVGVIAAAVLFLLSAIILSVSVARMLDNATKAEKAQSIQDHAGELQGAVTESSIAARAYLLSHDHTLLPGRAQAIRAVAQHLDVLGALLADDAIGRDLLRQTRTQVVLRISQYDDLIAHAEKDALSVGEAERLKLTRSGNALISQLRDRGRANFKRYQNRVTDDMHMAMILVLVAGITAPLFGLIGIRLLRRERESQQARELRLELIHVQRLAIMGETSAMLAHEINQPLTAATNYIAVVRRLLQSDSVEKTTTVLDRVEQQIQRAAAIVLKLRRFIEKREAERNAEAPETLVEDAITLLGTIDSTTTLKTKIAPNLPLVLVDRVQVQQVLVNLMRNAIEAMQGSARRELVLSMTCADDKTVQVSLADTGPGLSPDVTARLFQPFVSTKTTGMGVGLSICQNIVTQHGGRIWADANPSGGTVFRFTLPVAEERAAAA